MKRKKVRVLSSPFRFFAVGFALALTVFCCFSTETIAQTERTLIPLEAVNFAANGFVVHGKATNKGGAGITDAATYAQASSLPDLKIFFDFGGTLELLTSDTSLRKHDIVISEILWGTDLGATDITEVQWIELYNTTQEPIEFSAAGDLAFLLTPFENHPNREQVPWNGVTYSVLDAVSTLHLGKWDLPGQSGRRAGPNVSFLYVTNVVSAYRNIVYADVEETAKNRDSQLAGVPFGSYPESWKATPERGRVNTLRSIDGQTVSYIATPGEEHILTVFTDRVIKTTVFSNQIVINEVRNDPSSANLDWIELKNVGSRIVELDDWELSLVTKVGSDQPLINLPNHALQPREILLILNRHPSESLFADGINIQDHEEDVLPRGARHKYFVAPSLELPNTGRFLLLLRSEKGKRGKDEAIADYAGNGFFPDPSSDLNTEFWPRKGQRRPSDVADFGRNTFASPDSSWARIRYTVDSGHHKDAWQKTGAQGGIGYAPGADLSMAPGTPGYENDALKTRTTRNNFSSSLTNQYTDGEISISEVMYDIRSDAGRQQQQVQWIELYNASMTQAINLKGWELEVRNMRDDQELWVNSSFLFTEAIILPNQTLLLVSREGRNNVVDNRVYDLHAHHQHELDLNWRRSNLLNPNGFYLKLIDKGDPRITADDRIVDEAGNLRVENLERDKLWELPTQEPSVRRSLLRQYGRPLRRNEGGFDGVPDAASVGTRAEGWRPSKGAWASGIFYGHPEDIGTPGYRFGGPLPVVLSSFRAASVKTGEIIVSWVTESELDTAGFNVLRREGKSGAFKIINPTLIPGAGTSSERHYYSFADTTATSNTVYYYQLQEISLSGKRETLATVRRGAVAAGGKRVTQWSHLKKRR